MARTQPVLKSSRLSLGKKRQTHVSHTLPSLSLSPSISSTPRAEAPHDFLFHHPNHLLTISERSVLITMQSGAIRRAGRTRRFSRKSFERLGCLALAASHLAWPVPSLIAMIRKTDAMIPHRSPRKSAQGSMEAEKGWQERDEVRLSCLVLVFLDICLAFTLHPHPDLTPSTPTCAKKTVHYCFLLRWSIHPFGANCLLASKSVGIN